MGYPRLEGDQSSPRQHRVPPPAFALHVALEGGVGELASDFFVGDRAALSQPEESRVVAVRAEPVVVVWHIECAGCQAGLTALVIAAVPRPHITLHSTTIQVGAHLDAAGAGAVFVHTDPSRVKSGVAINSSTDVVSNEVGGATCLGMTSTLSRSPNPGLGPMRESSRKTMN